MASDSSNNERGFQSADKPERRELSWQEQAEADRRRRRLRSLAIAWALFAMAVIFFLVTIVRLGGNVANRPL
jgi:hypothetical protein